MGRVFHIGQRVVCINDEWHPQCYQALHHMPFPLSLGGIYTIAGYEIANSLVPGFGLGKHEQVFLAEAQNVGRALKSFHPSRFRPLRERKSDISIFRALLNTNEKKVEA